MPTGTIARLLIDKGFGFIRDEGGIEHFFHRSSVRGAVFDSLRHAPMPNVRVFLSGTSFAAVTASDGSYSIDAVPPGKYTASILSPRLDSLLLDPPARELTLSAGEAKMPVFT